MKTLCILSLSLLFVNFLFAQERAIRVSSTNTEKQIILKENMRIKVKTIYGEKIVGQFSISDTYIVIRGRQLKLSEI